MHRTDTVTVSRIQFWNYLGEGSWETKQNLLLSAECLDTTNGYPTDRFCLQSAGFLNFSMASSVPLKGVRIKS